MHKDTAPIDPVIGELTTRELADIGPGLSSQWSRGGTKKRGVYWLAGGLILISVCIGFYWQQQSIKQLKQYLLKAEKITQQRHAVDEEQFALTIQQATAKLQLLTSHLKQLKQQFVMQGQQYTVMQRELTLLKNQQAEHASLGISLSKLKQPFAELKAEQLEIQKKLAQLQQLYEQQQTEQKSKQEAMQELADSLSRQQLFLSELKRQQTTLSVDIADFSSSHVEQQALVNRILKIEQQLEKALQESQSHADLASLKADNLWLKMEFEQLQAQHKKSLDLEKVIMKQEFDAYKTQFNRRLSELEHNQ